MEFILKLQVFHGCSLEYFDKSLLPQSKVGTSHITNFADESHFSL